MTTAEFTAPGFSPAGPEAQPPFDPTSLPFAQVDAFLSNSPEVEFQMSHTATAADGRLGLRTADGYVSMFRVGQVAHVTFGNGSETTQSYYMGHDGELRSYDANAEFLPFEVRTFRNGLADRFGQPVDGRFAMADGEDIGAYVTGVAEAAPAEPRFARLRRLGSFALNEARNLAKRVSNSFSERAEARTQTAEAQAQAPASGRHRRDTGNPDRVTYTGPRHARHRAQHRTRHRGA
jgi:hypothetical protein